MNLIFQIAIYWNSIDFCCKRSNFQGIKATTKRNTILFATSGQRSQRDGRRALIGRRWKHLAAAAALRLQSSPRRPLERVCVTASLPPSPFRVRVAQ